MKPVMLATDGSPAAETATSTAVELAKLLGTDLLVVTVWDVPYSTLGFAAVPPSAELAQIGQDQASKVAAEAAARAEEVGVEARTAVLRGFPVEEICLAAEKYEPRFLVIGSHGWRTVKRVLFGSVSTGVLHHAVCPVLVVRGEETPQNGAKADGAREHIHAVS